MSNYFCTNSGCQPPCPPQQNCQPAQSDGCCCSCGEDFRRALNLLCSRQLQPLVDFTTFAYVSDFYVLGTALTATTAGTAPSDNLADPTGTYVCGGDGCETITASGILYPPTTDGTALATTVTQVALCRLTAIAFEALAIDGDTATNFQTISQTLGQLLRPQKPQDCCGSSMAQALSNAAVVRASTVVAGPLVVENSTVLGQIGNVLVMANSTDSRFYFICADKIDFVG